MRSARFIALMNGRLERLGWLVPVAIVLGLYLSTLRGPCLLYTSDAADE